MPTNRNHRFIRVFAIVAMVGSAACASLSTTEEEVYPSPTAGRPATPEEELTLIRADSELFAAVVRGQIEGSDDEYPYRLPRLRYDSRPYGTPSGYPELYAGVQGIDPTLSFARAGKSAIDDLVDNRKRILESFAVGEGEAPIYNQCAGASVPKPPPVRGSASRARRADVHAGCPRLPEYYITVGLPIRGQPEGLRGARDTRGRRVDQRGDVWTMLVTEHAAAPRGWSRTQYAWIFKRSRWGRSLELTNTVLIGVID